MLEELRTLLALEATGTLSEAAVRLRLTQSAVSKRLQALEAELGFKLVEPDGRRLRITSRGLQVLAKARGLLLEVEALKDLREATTARSMGIGIADSIASSWGPKVLKRALTETKGLSLHVHVHRSTMVLEQVRSGRYELGVVTGRPQGKDLVWDLIVEEPMVLVGSKKPSSTENILTIETQSATWKEIGSEVLAHPKLKGRHYVFLESFSAVLQMAKEGFGLGIVPLGLAKAFGVNEAHLTRLSPRIRRQVHLVKRKSIAELSAVQGLQEALKEHASFIKD